MILQSIFNPLKNEISVELGEEEARFKFGQMCCTNWLNISSVSELFLPVWFSIKIYLAVSSISFYRFVSWVKCRVAQNFKHEILLQDQTDSDSLRKRNAEK